MTRLLRVFACLVCLTLLLIAAGLAYSTAKGYLTWCFRVNGIVSVNGIKNSGYLHANTKRTFLLLTRTDKSRRETYLVPLQGSRWIVDCGDWHPTQFLPVLIGDVDPPCSGYDTPTGVADTPKSQTLITHSHSVEFSTISGKKIRAEW